jgi:hypothetical protein
VSQQDTCHPEAKRGISFSLSSIELNRDVTKDSLQKEGKLTHPFAAGADFKKIFSTG